MLNCYEDEPRMFFTLSSWKYLEGHLRALHGVDPSWHSRNHWAGGKHSCRRIPGTIWLPSKPYLGQQSLECPIYVSWHEKRQVFFFAFLCVSCLWKNLRIEFFGAQIRLAISIHILPLGCWDLKNQGFIWCGDSLRPFLHDSPLSKEWGSLGVGVNDGERGACWCFRHFCLYRRISVRPAMRNLWRCENSGTLPIQRCLGLANAGILD